MNVFWSELKGGFLVVQSKLSEVVAKFTGPIEQPNPLTLGTPWRAKFGPKSPTNNQKKTLKTPNQNHQKVVFEGF